MWSSLIRPVQQHNWTPKSMNLCWNCLNRFLHKLILKWQNIPYDKSHRKILTTDGDSTFSKLKFLKRRVSHKRVVVGQFWSPQDWWLHCGHKGSFQYRSSLFVCFLHIIALHFSLLVQLIFSKKLKKNFKISKTQEKKFTKRKIQKISQFQKKMSKWKKFWKLQRKFKNSEEFQQN